MLTSQMIQDYDNYLEEHIKNVKIAFEWMLINIPELFKDYDSEYLGEVLLNKIDQHDKSKYSEEEYFAYCEYFYGSNKDTKETLENFNAAWLHHQHYNPHHWQHWLLRQDDGETRALEMPYNHLLEMICDWWAFSWKQGNLYEIFDWYEINKHKQVLHDSTKKTVEMILNKLKIKLDELNGNKE